MHTWVPALLAVAAALMIAGGTVLRQRASAASGAITAGWWLGAAIAVTGFVLQASALGLGSILLVQPLVVLAVLFSLPMEAWAEKRRPSGVEWLYGGILVTCVVVFLVVAKPVPSARKPDVLLFLSTVAVVIAVLVVLVILAELASSHYRSLCYGLAAGTLFGVSALLIKAVALRVLHDPLRLFVSPEIYLLVAVVVCAVLAQQRAFGAGELQTSFPAMNVMEPAVAMVLGVVLLGENIYVSPPVAVMLAIVLGVMVVAVVKLAQISAVRSDPSVIEEPVRLTISPPR